MWQAIIYHSSSFLTVISIIIWYWHSYGLKPKKILNIIFYPFFHFRDALFLYSRADAFVLMFSYLMLLTSIERFVFPNNPAMYLISWSLPLLFGFYGVTVYTFRVKRWKYAIIILIVIAIFYSIGIYLSIEKESYNPMIVFDFIGQILQFLGTVYIIGRLILNYRFFEEMEAFFIFFPFCIYSVLQVISTIVVYLNIFQFFDYSANALRFLFLFWIVSIPCLRRLKSKYS